MTRYFRANECLFVGLVGLGLGFGGCMGCLDFDLDFGLDFVGFFGGCWGWVL